MLAAAAGLNAWSGLMEEEEEDKEKRKRWTWWSGYLVPNGIVEGRAVMEGRHRRLRDI